MKNTTFRKKALLSSVCMLLVALVALGSATFAWFTSSSSATAEGLGATTTKSSDLLVAKKDLEFDDNVDYESADLTLRPATSVDGENWYKAEAADKAAFDAKSGTFSGVTGSANYYFVDMLNIKNAGDVANSVSITVTADIDSTFARLAIVPVATQTVKNEMPSAATNFKANIYGAEKGDSWTPYTLEDGIAENVYTTKDVANGTVLTIDSLGAGDVASYKIMLWFEGEDPDCFDETKAEFDVPSVSFTVDGQVIS